MTNPHASAGVFISYARSDGATLAHHLATRLTHDHGLSVWRDLADLEGGTDWWRQVTEAIDHVEYVVVVVTAGALESSVVRDEWRYARGRGVCVIPIVADPHMDLSRLPLWMRRLHIVHPAIVEQWTRLVRTLEGPCQTPRVPLMADPPPPDFVERPTEFNAIRAQLIGDADGHPIAITAALKGAGGYGKTTLARALCHDLLVAETYYDGILWVTLGEQFADAAVRIEDLIVAMTGEPSGFTTLDARKSHLAELLRDRRVLIVIDDVWNAADLAPFELGGSGCARLITTRNSDTLPSDAHEYSVGAMRPSESIALLRAAVPQADAETLQALAARVGEWPLLVRLAGGIIRDRIQRHHETIAGAFDFVNEALNRRGLTAFDARDPRQRHQAVAATVEVSLARLTAQESARFRELAVFPEDVEIPLKALQLLWRTTGGLDAWEVEHLTQRLANLSLLLEVNFAAAHIRLHDVIRAYLLHDLTPLEQQWLHRRLVEAYRTECAGGWHSGPADAYFYRYLPHHLGTAHYRDELRNLLLDSDWLEAKLQHADIADVLGDYRVWASDAVTNTVHDALTLSADVLGRDATALLPQLLGRIDPGESDELRSVTARWRERPRQEMWLRPQTASLTCTGTGLVSTLHLPPEMSGGSAAGSLSISANGRRVAVQRRGMVHVIDSFHHRPVMTVDSETSSLSADGRWLVAGLSYQIRLYDLDQGVETWSTSCDVGPVGEVSVTADGRSVAALTGQWRQNAAGGPGWDVAYVWRVGRAAPLFERAAGGLRGVVLDNGGQHISVGLPAGGLETWDVVTAHRLGRWQASETTPRIIVAGTPPTEIVTANQGGTVQLWQIGRDWADTPISGRERERTATAVAVVPAGDRVCLGFDNGTIECRDWRDDRLVAKRLRAGAGSQNFYDRVTPRVDALAFTQDGRYLVSLTGDAAVQVWDVAKATDGPLTGVTGRIFHITSDGQRIVALNAGGQVVVRDEQKGTEVIVHGQSTVDAVTPDDRWLWSMRPDGTTVISDLRSGRELYAFEDMIVRVALFPDAERIICVAREGTALYRIENFSSWHRHDLPASLRGKTVHARIVAVPNTESTVVLSHRDGFSLFDPVGGAHELLPIPAGNDTPHHLRIYGQVIVGLDFGRVTVWDMHSGILIVEKNTSDDAVAALTPDGKRLVIADGTVISTCALDSPKHEVRFYAETVVTAVACPSNSHYVIGTVDGRLHHLELIGEAAPQLRLPDATLFE